MGNFDEALFDKQAFSQENAYSESAWGPFNHPTMYTSIPVIHFSETEAAISALFSFSSVDRSGRSTLREEPRRIHCNSEPRPP